VYHPSAIALHLALDHFHRHGIVPPEETHHHRHQLAAAAAAAAASSSNERNESNKIGGDDAVTAGSDLGGSHDSSGGDSATLHQPNDASSSSPTEEWLKSFESDVPPLSGFDHLIALPARLQVGCLQEDLETLLKEDLKMILFPPLPRFIFNFFFSLK
jgi:hypothetical protein